MTREEAIQCEMDYCPVGPTHPKYLNAVRVIDRYVRLGMLKLDEPKSHNKAFCLAYNLMNEEGHHAAQILSLLDAAGLKIVEK